MKFAEWSGVHLAAPSLEHAAVLGTNVSNHIIFTINFGVDLFSLRKAFAGIAKSY